MKKKPSNLKGVHVYIFIDDYLFLKEYVKKNGQRGDFTHLIKQSIRNTVDELKKIEEKCKD